MTAKLSIFGLGYVGCVSAGALARAGNQVIGVDVNQDKVEAINAGRSPIVEPDLPELIAEYVSEGRLTASADARDAVRRSDLSLICVGTPSHANGKVNLEYVMRVAEQIGMALREKESYHVIALRSTVVPGTTDELIDVVTNASGKCCGRDFGVCINPEFLREGTALRDFFDPPYTLIGQSDVESGDRLAAIYEGVAAPVIRTEIRTAELVKYANNAFHALKIAFANEMGVVAKTLGSDGSRVMELLCEDTRLNISSAYLKPGFAFGGSCLPKDLRALTYMAKSSDLATPLLSSVLDSNRSHLQRAKQLIFSLGRRKVGVLGVTFKPGTDDMRESPVVDLVETLIGKGYEVRIHDQNVQLARLHGTNREFIEQRVPHISRLLVADGRDLLDHAEVLIVGTNDPRHADVIRRAERRHVIIDLVGSQANAMGRSAGEYIGLCW